MKRTENTDKQKERKKCKFCEITQFSIPSLFMDHFYILEYYAV